MDKLKFCDPNFRSKHYVRKTTDQLYFEERKTFSSGKIGQWEEVTLGKVPEYQRGSLIVKSNVDWSSPKDEMTSRNKSAAGKVPKPWTKYDKELVSAKTGIMEWRLQ